MADMNELKFQIGHLTQDFLKEKMREKLKMSPAAAKEIVESLYKTSLFYYMKYGERYFNLCIAINCRVLGTNLADLNAYIHKHTGRANYFKPEKPLSEHD